MQKPDPVTQTLGFLVIALTALIGTVCCGLPLGFLIGRW